MNIKLQFYREKLKNIRIKIDKLEKEYNRITDNMFKYIIELNESWATPIKEHLLAKNEALKTDKTVNEIRKPKKEMKPILKAIAMKLHPDKNHTPNATKNFQNFNMAMQIGDYETILNIIIDNDIDVSDEKILVHQLKEEHKFLKLKKEYLKTTFLLTWDDLKTDTERNDFIRLLVID